MIKRPNTDESLAATLKALAHPARLKILRLLADRGTCVCGALVDAMPLSQATVSQHLKVLKEAGLVQGTIDGPRSCYCIDHGELARLRDHMADLFGSVDACCKETEKDML